MNMKNILKIFLVVVALLIPNKGLSQALRGTTGLLHAPTAEMQQDKTFMFGGNLLHTEPLHYTRFDVTYTFNYYFNITFFPWLEVGYTLTLNYANQGSAYFPKRVWGKYTNQDRSFYARFRLWEEGQYYDWAPQIVLGLDDPGTHTNYGGGGISTRDVNGRNCWFSRYYLAASKHIEFPEVGTIGAHLSFILDRPSNWYHHNRPAVGANFKFGLYETENWQKWINGLNLMAEYDARTINVGFHYQIYKDNINVVAELNEGKYFNGGIYFKLHLK